MDPIKINLPGDDDYYIAEAYKVLRTNLQFCGQDIKVIALTSCGENEGKSTVALGIGKSFADLGKKVLVIDADMRKSVIAGRNTTAKTPKGLSEVLTGMSDVSECLYPVAEKKMHVLFAGQYPPNPVELLSGKYFATLISECRKVYDYIIIDTPPLGLVIDAAVIADRCDGAVLVLGGPQVHRSEAQNVVEQLNKSGCKVLGVIRNKVRPSGKKSYYKYK